LKEEAEQLHKESSSSNDSSPSAGNAAPSKEPTLHDVIVKAHPVMALVNQHKSAHEQFATEALKNATLSTVNKAVEANSARSERYKTSVALNSSTDAMQLAELVSNAIGELEQARVVVEQAQADRGSAKSRVAELRVRNAERKVRLLSKIAQSLHELASAQAQSGEKHEVIEAKAQLRILELILSDVNSAVGKSATSASAATPVSPVALVAPVKPAPPVASVAPVAAVTPTSVPAATPATTPAPPTAATPAKPAIPSAPAKPGAVAPQSNLTREFSFFVGSTR
jgi:hypothetical protein